MSGSTITVLLLEDNPNDADLIRTDLSQATTVRFKVEWADRLSDGLEHLDADLFDIVLSDLSLPDSQGLQTLEHVIAAAPTIPIVVLTRSDDETLGLQAVQNGAQDYLVKDDIDTNVLSRVLQYAIERKHLTEELRQYRNHLEKTVAARTIELQRANRAFQVLSDCNQAVVRANEIPALLQEICQIIVDKGGYQLAWVGVAEQDTDKTVTPVAWAGVEQDYLKTIALSWADTALGRSPVGRSIRMKQPVIARDIHADPAFEPWRNEVHARNYVSEIALPLPGMDETMRVLVIYAHEPNAFDDRERDLLVELANDLAYGISSLRAHEERQQAQAALREQEQHFRSVVQTALNAIVTIDSQGSITLWNRAAETMFGYQADDMIGQSMSALMPEHYRQRFEDGLTRYLAAHESDFIGHSVEFAGLRKDGREFPLELTVAAWTDGNDTFFSALIEDITERKRAAEALEQSEARYRLVSELTSDYAYAIRAEPDGRQVREWATEGFTRITGYTLAEIPEYDGWKLLVHPDDAEVIRDRVKRLYRGEEVETEYRIITKEGELRWLHELTRPILDSQNRRLVHVYGAAQDITERKLAEEALRQTQRTLTTLMDHLPGMVYRCRNDQLWTMEFVSIGSRELTGYGPGDLVDNRTIAYAHLIREDDRQMVQNTIQRAVENDELYTIVYRILTRDQQEKWVWEQGRRTVHADGKDVILEGLILDVTQRIQASNAEREQRVRAEMMADLLSSLNRATDLSRYRGLDIDQVLTTIVNGLVEEMNLAFARIWLLDEANQMLILHASAGLHTHLDGEHSHISLEEDAYNISIIARTQQRLVSNHVQDDARFDSAWAKERRIVSFAGFPLELEGQLIGVLGIFSQHELDNVLLDVLSSYVNQTATAIENARLYRELENYNEYLEQAVKERTNDLRDSEERFRRTFEQAAIGIGQVTLDGHFLHVNQRYCDITGYSERELCARRFVDITHPDDIEADLAYVEEVLAGKRTSYAMEKRYIRKDGTPVWIYLTVALVRDSAGDPAHFIGTIEDITTRKQAEEAIQQALEREMEVSNMRMRFLSMASHDLRNPLAVIRSSVDMLADYHDRLSEEKKATKFRHIRASVAQMVELLDDVLTFGQAEVGELTFIPQMVDLEAFCRGLMDEIKTTVGTRYILNLEFIGDGGSRISDPKLLRHILFNLLSNAVKYSPVDSEVTLEVKFSGAQTVFRIQDQGIGIPEADIPRLFEPFHRAGNIGVRSGTGLGLAIVKQSVELHGGTVHCETQEGVGTTFTVVLPNLPTKKIR